MITIVLWQTQEKEAWSTPTDDDHTASLLMWVFTLLIIVGVGFVKISVALTTLRSAVRNWHRHTTLGFICRYNVIHCCCRR